MNWLIPLHAPWLPEEDAEAVYHAVAEGWVSTASPVVSAFESSLSQYFGGKQAHAVQSGTAALYLALRAAGAGPGDWVLMPDLAFGALANAIALTGASPILFDCGEQTLNLDPDLVEDFLFGCETRPEGIYWQGRRVAVLAPVHVMGIPADMDRLVALAAQYRLPLVEDAAEAIGSFWHGRPMGSLGDFGCLSFNGNKIITTSGGGAVLSGHAEAMHKVQRWSAQSKMSPKELTDHFGDLAHAADLGHYAHWDSGFNFRMTGLAAALGLSQWQRLEEALVRKMRWADLYAAGLAGGGAEFPRMPKAALWNAWLNTVFVPDRDGLLRRLQQARIEARPLWMPMHRQPWLAGAPLIGGGVQADLAFRHGVCLPSGPGLEDALVVEVIEQVKAFLAEG